MIILDYLHWWNNEEESKKKNNKIIIFDMKNEAEEKAATPSYELLWNCCRHKSTAKNILKYIKSALTVLYLCRINESSL